MNINNSTSIASLNNISATTPPQQHEVQMKLKQNKIQEEGIDISKIGMASSLMSSLSPTEKVEITDFAKVAQEAKKSGNFDAEKLAQQAPDSVKTLAKQLNKSTEEMLTNMSDKGSQGLISLGNTRNESPSIDAYLNVSAQTDQSDSLFDLFDLFSDDD